MVIDEVVANDLAWLRVTRCQLRLVAEGLVRLNPEVSNYTELKVHLTKFQGVKGTHNSHPILPFLPTVALCFL